MAKLEDIKCDSGRFLLVKNFEAKDDIAVDTTVHLIDKKTLIEWFQKGAANIGEGDRIFCVASELVVSEESIRRQTLTQSGKVVLESVV